MVRSYTSSGNLHLHLHLSLHLHCREMEEKQLKQKQEELREQQERMRITEERLVEEQEAQMELQVPPSHPTILQHVPKCSGAPASLPCWHSAPKPKRHLPRCTRVHCRLTHGKPSQQ